MIVRLTLRYILLFLVVLAAMSFTAYVLVGKIYASDLQPALGLPEYAGAYATAMRSVATRIMLFDLPLVVLVAALSYLLARAHIAPILEARDRERRFAADAAHELRSPLATIAIVAQSARADAPPGTQAQLDTIARTALDASAIVADLLTLAREPAAHALTSEPIDLAIVARQCVQEFAERAKAANIEMRLETKSALINGDQGRVRELLRNLLENGLRHARGSLVVRTAQSGKTASLSVQDDGPGIEPSMQERVFDRFYRGSVGGEGLGLGLSIGRWIALAHGGELRAVNHDASGGALFVATFPALG
ncbi:MAG: HAMP domain-containing histidine kinase [Candidatus Eremiobacteraeota bacterium]|nr:HAMP domain-containing histidine kinase [Candidatus Eremiobacteraeota bacterium]